MSDPVARGRRLLGSASDAASAARGHAKEAGSIVGGMFTYIPLQKEQTPLSSARLWLQAGLPPSAAPSRELLEEAQRGPQHVDLSRGEAACLARVLESPCIAVAPEEETGGDEAALVARGVLLDAGHGPALAPAHLLTLGVRYWARRAGAVQRRTKSAGTTTFSYGIVGTRAALSRPHAGGFRVTRLTPDQLACELALALGPPWPSGEQYVGFYPRWVALVQGELEPFELRGRGAARLTDAGGGRVRWTTEQPVLVDEFPADRIQARVEQLLARGRDDDERVRDQLLASAALIRRPVIHPLGGSTVGDLVIGTTLERIVPGWGRKERRLAAYEERKRQRLARNYWARKPRFR